MSFFEWVFFGWLFGFFDDDDDQLDSDHSASDDFFDNFNSFGD